MKEFVLEKMEDFYEDSVQLFIRDLIKSGGCRVKVTKLGKSRTLSQNSAMFLWFEWMAEAMNDAGYSHRKLWEAMKASFDIPVTKAMLHEIASGVSEDMFNERHISKLDTKDFSKLYEVLNEAFGRSVGVSLAFPSDEPEQYGN